MSTRSAITPVHAPIRSIGSVCSASVMPRAVPESVSSSTSQLCASICIHDPTVEISSPTKKARKLRFFSATNDRDSATRLAVTGRRRIEARPDISSLR